MKKHTGATAVGSRDTGRAPPPRGGGSGADTKDDAFREITQDFVGFCARFQENRARIAACLGLSVQQYTVLSTISHHKDKAGFGIIQVADELRLSGAFVTIEVNKLVAAGLVRKRLNLVDRRRVLLSVTARGRDLLERGSSIVGPSNETIFGDLSAAHFDLLATMIPKLVDNIIQSLRLVEFLHAENAGIGGKRRSQARPASIGPAAGRPDER